MINAAVAFYLRFSQSQYPSRLLTSYAMNVIERLFSLVR